jgi:hypothetical protein
MDWALDDFAETEAKTEREIVPEGEHAFEIRSATEGPHKYREGEFLSLRLSALNGSHQFVFCDIPKGKQGARLAASLAKALGLEAGGSVSIDPTEIQGRTVRATIWHKVAASGRTYVNVEKFSPDVPAEPPARKAKKVDAAPAAAAPDDIPF